MCRVLQVTRAAFYKWLGRTTSTTQQKQKQIVNEIKRIHTLPRHQDYGSPRVHRELVKQGTACSVNTVAKLMRINGIQARNKPRFRIATTDSKHDLPIAPNRLNQQFTISKINKVWLTDFTYIPTCEGFSYLCAFKDLCSRRIVGWAMSRKIDAQLAIKALHQAVALREPPRGLIIHSDRGSQFASNAFRKRIHDCRFKQSMSRKGNCYDNAPMESFFKSFKVEEVYHEKYETHEHAVRAANDYIERFYNPKRLHSALGYVSPTEFEQRLVLK
jgi:transposase InsO family protein